MSLYVLDTDTLTLWLSGHPHVVSRVASTEDDRLSVSVVSVEECLSGWYAQIRKSARDDIRLARAYRSLQDTVEVLGQMRILPFDAPAIARFRELRKSFRRTGANDLKIAATVLENQAILVPRNTADFGIPGQSLEYWSRPALPAE